MNGICLLYIYALFNPNPHGPHYYETEQIKLNVYYLRQELDELKAERAKK